jgi:hypothetical protein
MAVYSYYYQLFYVYVPSVTRSTTTSTLVTTTTTVVVQATDSAAARAQFQQVTATADLPTPDSATRLPPLPSQTLDVPATTGPTVRIAGGGPTSTPTVVSPSTGASAGSLWGSERLYAVVAAWAVLLAVGAGVLQAN